jgi:cytolethal distending toxin subunit A
MTIFRRRRAGPVASGVLVLGLSCVAGDATQAAPIPTQGVMLINVKTEKCLTIAGGTSTANNVDAVQFNCDRDRSRTWTLRGMGGGIFQIRNVKTGKCLTIAGGESTANNVRALQFDCDSHASRTWRISDVTGSNIFQLRNVRTGKCLTIAGGESSANNVLALQFNCDSHPSRRWTIRQRID